MTGEYAGIWGRFGKYWSWLAIKALNTSTSAAYGRCCSRSGFFWVVILFRGLRGKLQDDSLGNMPWLFFFAALSIPAFYSVGLLAQPDSHFTTTDFWRFWVVHLWVEDFLELFTTIMVAYIFVLLGVVHERVALAVIYLDILLYSAGGVVGPCITSISRANLPSIWRLEHSFPPGR
jgi:nitric oxide reductase subunit B